jgi:hypothetical protein
MAMNKDFAVFILTHGRPDNLITFNTLNKCGYTGKVFLVIDNEDKRADEYFKLYGRDMVVQFDKKRYADECDECNNFDERRTITMARNACFDIAKKIGVKYFMQLDDDYTQFKFRFVNKLGYEAKINKIDNVFNSFIKFYDNTPVLSIAFSQGGDHIGGFSFTKLKRKCMNSFLCSTDRPFKFIGAMNEDVNTYTTLGSRGKLFLTFTSVQLTQKETQSQEGGITDMYKKYGTYCKAFTTVINMPSSVKVTIMTSKHQRLHHSIKWNNTVPKIVSEKLRKTAE